MDFTKLRFVDLINPVKWEAAIEGTYYENVIGFHKCQQAIIYANNIHHPLIPATKEDWIPYVMDLKHGTPYPWEDMMRRHLQGPFVDIPLAFAEQAVIRSLKCYPCYLNKNCKHCGCTTPDAFMAPINFCSKRQWDSFAVYEEWPVLRKIHALKIVIYETYENTP